MFVILEFISFSSLPLLETCILKYTFVFRAQRFKSCHIKKSGIVVPSMSNTTTNTDQQKSKVGRSFEVKVQQIFTILNGHAQISFPPLTQHLSNLTPSSFWHSDFNTGFSSNLVRTEVYDSKDLQGSIFI